LTARRAARAFGDGPLVFGCLHLHVHHAGTTLNLSTAHQTALGGEVGGVLETEELVAEVMRRFGLDEQSLCGSRTLDAIVGQVRAASDILEDGTEDPAKTCDGISIGFGFTMARVGLGNVAAPMVPKPSPCGG
jgi:hypothetical protein